MLEYNEVVNMDYRLYVIDMNLEKYFKEELSGWDKINKVMIDPNKRSQREKFQQYIEELLDVIPIEDTIFEILSRDKSRELLERID